MKGSVRVVAFALLLAGAAHVSVAPVLAGELTAAERAWVRACVAGLTAPSPRQRESAAAALVRLGPEAIPAIGAETHLLKTDDQWATLEAVLAGMGPAEALKALEASVKEWPEGTAGRRQTLIDHLTLAVKARTHAPAAASEAPPPLRPEQVAAKVRAILDSFDADSSYREEDPRIRELVQLGRPGVALLLEDLWKERRLHSFRTRAATAALRRLLVVGDVPAVARLLDVGHLEVAPALSRLPGEVVVPVLIAPLARGFHGFELVQALRLFRRDPRVVTALVAWLDADPVPDGSSVIGSTAELLAQADARVAVPSLLRALERSTELDRLQLALALVDLGEKRGIPALLDVFRAPATPRNGFERHASGERLNELAGRRIYQGKHESGMNAVGNFEEAIPRFAAWWTEVKDTMRYDTDRRTWVTK